MAIVLLTSILIYFKNLFLIPTYQKETTEMIESQVQKTNHQNDTDKRLNEQMINF